MDVRAAFKDLDGFVGAAGLERLETSSDDKVHSAHAD
jgi:hypothetical protein